MPAQSPRPADGARSVPAGDPVAERFHFLVNAPALFNALVTALEWDVFGHLSAHPGASSASGSVSAAWAGLDAATGRMAREAAARPRSTEMTMNC
ncbi:hypothetical protein ABZ177_25235 [Streptomyces sp. NPDC006284]|uniref:hypothetical protein n=1 Tax=unclassified Streptomyces TaxID=2593676 RepID=UPI0033A6DE39